MPNWKEMYLHLMQETDRAVRILTEAQQTCKELYLRSGEPDLHLILPSRSGQEEQDSSAP